MENNGGELTIEGLQERFDRERDPAAKFQAGLALANALSNRGKRDQALEVLAQARPFARDDREEAAALLRMADVLNKKSDYEAAVSRYEEAVVKLAAAPDSLELLDAYLQIATIYWRQGYVERAGSFLDGARLVMQLRQGQTGRDQDRARADLLHVQAIIDGANGDQDAAIRDYQEEIGLLQALGDDAKLGSVYNNLSGLYKAQGQLATALQCQLRAMDIAEQAGEPLSIAISCNNLAEIYFALGCEDKAVPYYSLYLDLNKKIANRMGDAFGNCGLGRICQSRGEYEKAERHFRTALAVAREVKSRGKEIGVLTELADLYCDWERPAAAAQALDESIRICLELQLFNTLRHQVLNARILHLEAMVVEDGGREERLAKARAILESVLKGPIAVEDEEATSAFDLEVECHLLLAKVLKAQGQAAAAEHVAQAAGMVAAFAARLPEDLRRSYLSRRKVRDLDALKAGLAAGA